MQNEQDIILTKRRNSNLDLIKLVTCIAVVGLHPLLIKAIQHFVTINIPVMAMLFWATVLLSSFVLVYVIYKLPFKKYLLEL